MRKIALLLCLVLCLMASACQKEGSYTYQVSGKFYLLDEPFKHNYAPYTIKAYLVTGTPYLDCHGYALADGIPKWAVAGDTVEVEATLRELYPRGAITNCEASNIPVYKIVKIKKR